MGPCGRGGGLLLTGARGVLQSRAPFLKAGGERDGDAMATERKRSGDGAGRRRWPRGCTQVYTGDGKGKTTAALGLAVRAAGAGLRAFVGQFSKTAATSDAAGLALLGGRVTLRTFGRKGFVVGPPRRVDIEAAAEGLREARAALTSGGYDVVVLDEALVAAHLGLIRVEDVLELIAARPAGVELVLTGRRADPGVIAAADLVTEMREIKHYYAAGMPARVGIEE
jgi:cob(I)alamin adenosyltransferase